MIKQAPEGIRIGNKDLEALTVRLIKEKKKPVVIPIPFTKKLILVFPEWYVVGKYEKKRTRR